MAVRLASASEVAACADLPSIGSAGHEAGDCKPCVFMHTKGCQNGSNCEFCHLCGPDEKKLRQKAKRFQFQQARASGKDDLYRLEDVMRPMSPQIPAADILRPRSPQMQLLIPATMPPSMEDRSRTSPMVPQPCANFVQPRPPQMTDLTSASTHVPYVVRNTFIDTSIGLPTLYDEDSCDRTVSSCPAARIGLMRMRVPSQLEDIDAASTADMASTAPETPKSWAATPWPSTPEPMMPAARSALPHGLVSAVVQDTSVPPMPLMENCVLLQQTFPAAEHVLTADISMPSMHYAVAAGVEPGTLAAPMPSILAPNPPVVFVQPPPESWVATPMASLGQHSMVEFPMPPAPPLPPTERIGIPQLPPAPVQPPMSPPFQQPIPGSRILSLADVIGEPQLPASTSVAQPTQILQPVEGLPSVGSAEHATRNCKPCGFFHKAGCEAGAQCNYCHLCGPTEKKKRQKEKREKMRELAIMNRRFAFGGA